MPTLYEILQVDPSISHEDLKKVYKKLALKHHPDKNGDSDTFKAISHAYNVLSDPVQRKNYDLSLAHGDSSPPFDDILQNLMRGFGGFGFTQPQQQQRPVSDNIQIVQVIDMLSWYRGDTLKIPFKRMESCNGCSGIGGAKEHLLVCSNCSGKGKVTVQQQMGPFVSTMISVCDTCAGLGHLINPEHVCKVCNGNRMIEKNLVINLTLNPDWPDGHTHVLKGQSHKIPDSDQGDVILILKCGTHPLYQRVHNHSLYLKLKVPLKTVLCGGIIQFPSLDDTNTISYSVDPASNIRNGSKIELDFGFSSSGKLILEFDIDLPTFDSLTDDQRSQLAELLPP